MQFAPVGWLERLLRLRLAKQLADVLLGDAFQEAFFGADQFAGHGQFVRLEVPLSAKRL